MNRKKVVLLIVEGESEEILLYDRLRELFRQHEIRIEVQRGDILFNDKNKTRPIKNIIGDKVRQFLKERRFERSDILAVLHIIDTDGCLIGNENVLIKPNQDKATYYNEESITVQNESQQEYIISRNEYRTRNIRTMNSIDTIISGSIKYRVFYFSRNLEHVLFNEPNPIQGQKLDDIERFIEELTQPVESFLKTYMPGGISDDISIRYRESWEEMERENASLKRFTNVPLLFDFLREF